MAGEILKAAKLASNAIPVQKVIMLHGIIIFRNYFRSFSCHKQAEMWVDFLPFPLAI